jgi:hypothetical protein
VSADEIFILVLTVLCFGGLAIMEMRSRARSRAAAAAGPSSIAAPDEDVPAAVDPPVREAGRRKNKRR